MEIIFENKGRLRLDNVSFDLEKIYGIRNVYYKKIKMELFLKVKKKE